MKTIALLPSSAKYIRSSKKIFGRLSVNPMERLPAQLEMTRWLLDAGCTIDGKSFFEVGTGHIPVMPIGFFLCGAQSVVTVDLHRRVDWELTSHTLLWFIEHRTEVENMYRDVVNHDLLSIRLDMIAQYAKDPETFFRRSGISYMAPVDAGATGFSSGDFNYHISCTVLEHISLPELRRIFIEAKRLLSPDGKLIHFIDPSDHFQHQDETITKINFLRFSDKEWGRIAENQFAYCNRLRMSDYMRLFESLGYVVERSDSSIDEESLIGLSKSFRLAEDFSAYAVEDVCAMNVKCLLRCSDGCLEQ